jgi:hypothetical protein
MTYPTGAPGEDPRQQPFGPVDPVSDAVEYPPIEYNPTPPPGYSLPPNAQQQGYFPPQNYGPPPGYVPPTPSFPPPPGVYGPPPGYTAPPGYGPPPVYGVPPGYGAPKTNGLATASLVCGLVSLPGYIFCIGLPLALVAVVLGIVAITQVNKTPGEKGKEMAIAGIVIGALGLVGGGALVMLGTLPSL